MFDFLFYMTITVIVLNIIFGIIIDTFGQLRHEKEAIKYDQDNVCLICSYNRLDFDRHTERGFEVHRAEEHNPKAYIFFYVHLKTKAHIDFTGVEKFVHECIERNSTAWLPLHRALSMKGRSTLDHDDGAAKQSKESLAELRRDMMSMMAKVQQLTDKMESSEKRAAKVKMRHTAVRPAAAGPLGFSTNTKVQKSVNGDEG